MSVDLQLTAFFDAAVEQYLLSTSDRVLGELTTRRADVMGAAAVPIAVAVALLARAREMLLRNRLVQVARARSVASATLSPSGRQR